MKELVIVTNNKDKLKEIEDIARRFGIKVAMPKRKCKKLEIQADAVSTVSAFCAVDSYKKIRKPLVVDDSGLFIRSLKGYPGVYSAQAGATIGSMGILKLIKGVKDRSAYFECAATFFDGKTLRTFVGRCRGKIMNDEKGSNGFGFDPIFTPKGSSRRLAEMSTLEKNRFSHRGAAFKSLFRWYSR